MKAPAHTPTALDRLTARLHTTLRSETNNVIEVGTLLIECSKLLRHGEWQSWLSKNFDMSIRSAFNYEAAAKYVERHKSATVADLAPSVLYALAAGRYSKGEEAAILAATRKGRVDSTRADAICDALRPPPPPPPPPEAPPPPPEDNDDEDGDGSAPPPSPPAGDDSPDAILDGPPPAVPPPAPIAATDFALRTFDQAVAALKSVMTKRASQFAGTTHSVGDLTVLSNLIAAVARAKSAEVKQSLTRGEST